MAISQRVTARLRSIRTGPWVGIDEKTEAHGLIPEKCRDARNVQMDEKPGAAIKRDGSRVISLLPSGNPARDVEVFARSDGVSFLLASDGTDLYFTTDPTEQSLWTLLVAGLDSDAFLEFETAEDKIWGTNGVDRVFSWDGTTLRTYDREFQSITDAVSITTTTVQHVGLTDADDFWNGQTIAWTAGTNAGERSTVTDFDAATDTLTFTPALPNTPDVTDRFKVGLIIPQGRAIRFWDARLWMASTTVNLSELRFHRLTDPNTGADIPIDDPIAWPPTFQLDINSADGDRIWGITPVLRDRFMVHKSTGFFRIERDPLTIYTFEVVSRAIGSRFQRSFAEKKALLYFFGQDKDGLPDLYQTDMVNIRPVDPDGGLEPTLRSLRQPNAVQRSILFSSTSEFDSATKSSNISTVGNVLTTNKTPGTPISAVNVALHPGKDTYTILGIPAWDERYDGSTLPAAATLPWTEVNSGPGLWTQSGPTKIAYVANPLVGGTTTAQRNAILATNKTAYATMKASAPNTGGSGLHLGVWNGARFCYFVFQFTDSTSGAFFLNSTTPVIFNAGLNPIFWDPALENIYSIQLDTNGDFRIWVNGTLWQSGNNATTTLVNRVAFGPGASAFGSVNDPSFADNGGGLSGGGQLIDYVYSSQDSAFAPATNLPLTGTATFQFDQTRDPDALRRLFTDVTLNGGTLVLESFTSDTADFSTGNDPAGFLVTANGAVPASLVKRFQRVRITWTAVDVSEGPELESIATGALWLSSALFIGSNIEAWRNFLSQITILGSSFVEIKIRSTTVLTPPAEIDWTAFSTITSGTNIGTILADGSPPSTRQVQLKVEFGPDATGLLATIQSLLVQWNEGSADTLPLHGIVHKKRYLSAAAQSTSASNNIVIVSDRNEGWMKYFGWDVNAMIHFQGALIGFSSTDDAILELDSAGLKSDRGAAIQAFVETREELGSREDLRKDWRYGVLHVGTIASTITVSLKRVSDSGFVEAVTKTLEGRALDKRINFRPGTVTKRLQRRYENNVLNEGMEINGETLYYSLRSQLPNGG